MKIVASIKDEDERMEAEEAFLSGQSPDMVKAQFKSCSKDDDEISPLDYLIAERDRLEKSVENLIVKISTLDNKIEELKSKQLEEQSA